MTEVESVVNSRPLTYTNTSSPDSPVALSPVQLLTLKSKVVLPAPGTFVKEDMYCRKRWRRVQFMANEFWQRWRKEILPLLHIRQKWNKVEDDLQVDDIVLIADETLPRNQWLLARITCVHPSQDGLIRKVTLKTATSSPGRPTHKLTLVY